MESSSEPKLESALPKTISSVESNKAGNLNVAKINVSRTRSDPAAYRPAPVSEHQRYLEVFAEEPEQEIDEISKAKNKHKNLAKTDKHPGTVIATTFDEEISTGLPSDLPSDLFDIEGNLLYGSVHHLRFGLEDDDFSSAEDDDYVGEKSQPDKPTSQVPSPEKGKDKKKQNSPRSTKNSPSARLSRKDKPIVSTSTTPVDSKNVKVMESLGSVNLGNFQGNDNRRGVNKSGHKICHDNFQEKKIKNVRHIPRKYNTVDEVCHPLIRNGNKITNPAFQGLPIPAKRHLSSSSGSTGAPNTTTNTTSNSGNFSPPSDQFRNPLAPFDRHHSSGGTSSNSSSTITQHYYPESGYGYVVLVTCTICHALTSGFQLSFGILANPIMDKFGSELQFMSCWLGAVSLGISLLFSPVWVSICKKKSTRLSAVFGGLMASLGCLFTSFASQFHQTFISYGAFLGIGVGLSRDAASLMVGQYFKRKREVIEIIVVSGSGLGIIIMSISIHTAIGSLGWRLGLQAVTVSLILTFFLGTCYRSASLYHPQRRAILHLKNQKRKVKEKGKRDDKPPFIDCSCLRSKTLRIILMSSACTAFGIFTPLLSLAVQCSKKGFEDCSILLLHIYIGTSWVIGCCTLGLVVIQKSQDCRVSKQYLCQVASVICGISILALTAVKGTNGMVVFSWVYGASLGAYCYCLKVYTYERARARHFPRAWSFLQSFQAIPLFFGVPLTNYANEIVGWKSGYYLSALAVFVGTACLFLTDVRRRKLSRRKSQNSSMKTCETTDGGTSSPKSKRLSFAFPVEQLTHQQQHGNHHDTDDEEDADGHVDPSVIINESILWEEGLGDVDFPDICLDEWADYIEECITSCNKVENCLASEYDHEAMMMERRARRWSAAKQQHHQQIQGGPLPATTGRLTLPGIGTVLEVPLLVAKRLHPALGLRSHQYHLAHQQLPREAEYCENGCGGARNDAGGGATTQTRVYQHPGKSRAGNLPHSQFPAIDEDSV